MALFILLIFGLPIVALGVYYYYENKKEEQAEQTENGTSREEKKQFFTNFNSENKESSEKETMLESLSRVGGWVNTLFKVGLFFLVLATVIGFIIGVGEEAEIGFAILFGGLVAIITLVFDYIIAGYFYFAARDKGYEELFYLAAPFFFPAIGHLLVIALPDRGNGRKER